MKKSLLLAFIMWLAFTTNNFAQNPIQIEVFDVSESKVVKIVPLEENMKNEAVALVKSIDSLFPKLNPTPRSGIMIKVPFDPPYPLENKLVMQSVNEVIFIFPEAERPYVLIFNKNNQPMFYYFQKDSSEFLTLLGIS